MQPEALRDALLTAAEHYPEAWIDTPWGEHALKVRKKVFLFLGVLDGDFTMSAKLPQSGGFALDLPFAKPMGYGLGQSGWVSFRLSPGQGADPVAIADWLHESYGAVAPKKLSSQLDGPPPAVLEALERVFA